MDHKSLGSLWSDSCSNSPSNYKMVKETRKRSSVHTLCPSLASPLPGMLVVSWHWQVDTNPRQGFPFGGCLQSLRGTAKPEQGSSLFVQGVSFIHTAHRRISKVRQKMCILRKQSLKLWAFLPFPEDPGQACRMIAYCEWCRILDLWRRFSFENRDQAYSFKSFCAAEFY